MICINLQVLRSQPCLLEWNKWVVEYFILYSGILPRMYLQVADLRRRLPGERSVSQQSKTRLSLEL